MDEARLRPVALSFWEMQSSMQDRRNGLMMTDPMTLPKLVCGEAGERGELWRLETMSAYARDAERRLACVQGCVRTSWNAEMLLPCARNPIMGWMGEVYDRERR